MNVLSKAVSVLSEELEQQLPQTLDRETIAAVIELPRGIGGARGETVLLLHEGGWSALTRDTSLEAYTFVELDEESPASLRAEEAGPCLRLRTKEGISYPLPLSSQEVRRYGVLFGGLVPAKEEEELSFATPVPLSLSAMGQGGQPRVVGARGEGQPGAGGVAVVEAKKESSARPGLASIRVEGVAVAEDDEELLLAEPEWTPRELPRVPSQSLPVLAETPQEFPAIPLRSKQVQRQEGKGAFLKEESALAPRSAEDWELFLLAEEVRRSLQTLPPPLAEERGGEQCPFCEEQNPDQGSLCGTCGAGISDSSELSALGHRLEPVGLERLSFFSPGWEEEEQREPDLLSVGAAWSVEEESTPDCPFCDRPAPGEEELCSGCGAGITDQKNKDLLDVAFSTLEPLPQASQLELRILPLIEEGQREEAQERVRQEKKCSRSEARRYIDEISAKHGLVLETSKSISPFLALALFLAVLTFSLLAISW